MGVPTLTKENNSFMFRCGESINNNLNMQSWIAKNSKDYVNKAEDFSNKKILKNIRKKMDSQNKKSILFDSKRFSNEFVDMLYQIV